MATVYYHLAALDASSKQQPRTRVSHLQIHIGLASVQPETGEKTLSMFTRLVNTLDWVLLSTVAGTRSDMHTYKNSWRLAC